MDEKTRNDLAIFRFSLIAPLTNGTLQKPMREYLEEICAKKYEVPGLGLREFSPSTLRHWLYCYNKYGFDGLRKELRSDRGQFRTLSAEAQQFIMELLKASPKMKASSIYEQMLAAQLLGTPSLSTIQRFVKRVRNTLTEPDIERRRYECEFANDCWQSDVCFGPDLIVDGKKKKAYLIALLDDASRLVVHSQFFFEENYLSLEATLRQALLKRGIPKKLFVDNGKLFRSRQLQLICARLGIALSFTRPYSPASKGKIERYFRTLRGQFLDCLDIQDITSIEHLNQLLYSYVETTYNIRPHSSLGGQTPMERFLKDQERLRFVSGIHLNEAFLHSVTRRATKDAVVSVKKVAFEVPQIYCGQQVEILFTPQDLNHVFLQPPHGGERIRIEPVQLIDNSRIPRKQNQHGSIDFSQFVKE